MTYTRGIPDGAQSPAVQQAPLQTNTNLADDYFGVDHNAFSAASDQGEHKQITYTAPLAVAPAPAGTKAALYTETIAGQTELVYKNAGNTYQLTPPGAAIFTPAARARVRFDGANWILANSTTFTGVTRTAAGQFTLSAAPATFLTNSSGVLVTSGLSQPLPNPLQNTGITATVRQVLPASITLIFVTASGVVADPPTSGFSILVF